MTSNNGIAGDASFIIYYAQIAVTNSAVHDLKLYFARFYFSGIVVIGTEFIFGFMCGVACIMLISG
jgi:hypothetical protein